MKPTSWRMGVGWLIALVFACLLLSGIQRLIFTESSADLAENEWICRKTWICSISDSSHERQTDKHQNDGFHRNTFFITYLKSKSTKDGSLYSDANGNVLSNGSSYLKTVYLAFPLGDGFA